MALRILVAAILTAIGLVLLRIDADAGIIMLSGGRGVVAGGDGGGGDPQPALACAEGDVIEADSPSQADVAAAIAAASVGDTVLVPAGEGTWNSLSVNKAVCLTGAGMGETVITLGTGNEIIKQPDGVTYIRGFTFLRSGGGNSNYGWEIEGSWLNARPVVIEEVEHVVANSGLYHIGVAGGVVIAKSLFSGGVDDSFIRPKSLDDGGGRAGDSESWSTDHSMGMADTNGELNIYIEGNKFTYGGNQAVDCDDASRCVYRYNQALMSSFNSHGLATSEIGVRHWEIYENDFQYVRTGFSIDDSNPDSNMSWFLWIRGATGVIFNNTFDDLAFDSQGMAYWGDKEECRFDIRAQQDNSGASYGDFTDGRAWRSAGVGDYPRQHQLAVNWSSTEEENGGYFIDPIYIWGNTGAGTNASGGCKAILNNGAWGGGNNAATYFQSGRDYFNDGTARPNYEPYTYPHPLRQTTGTAYD